MGLLPPSHIDQGLVFGALGIWHLSNTLVSFVKFPSTFSYRTWFPVDLDHLKLRIPSALVRCLELWLLLLIIIGFLSTQISHALPDIHLGSIQAEHLQRYQHITFALFFLLYAILALVNDGCCRLPLPTNTLHAIFALGFLMELFVFHLGHHPGDSLESFEHMLMQVILACLVSAMFLEILFPQNFLISLSRCMLLVLKGTWFFQIGLLINYPARFAPIGCVMDDQGGDFPVCQGMPLMRAKSIQVLVFGWQVFGILLCTVLAYAGLVGCHVGAAAREHYLRLGSLHVNPKLDSIQELDLIMSDDEYKRSLSRRRSSKGMTTP